MGCGSGKTGPVPGVRRTVMMWWVLYLMEPRSGRTIASWFGMLTYH